MAAKIGVNNYSGNGLLPDGTKPLPEPVLTYHQCSPFVFTTGAISQQLLKISILESNLKIIPLTLYMLHFSEATKTYIDILSFLHIDMTKVVEIRPQVRQELTYPTESISWL